MNLLFLLVFQGILAFQVLQVDHLFLGALFHLRDLEHQPIQELQVYQQVQQDILFDMVVLEALLLAKM